MKNLVFLLLVFFSLKSLGQQTSNEEYSIDISDFKIDYQTNRGSYIGQPFFMTLDVDEAILISDNTNKGQKKTTYFLHYKISPEGKIYFITGSSKLKKGVQSSNFGGISISESYTNNQKFIQLLNEYMHELKFNFYKNGKETFNFSPFSSIVFSNDFTFNVKYSRLNH